MKETILGIIKNAVEELNEELEYEELEDVSGETVLFGGDNGIDSISLVSLVMEVESNVNEEFDSNVTLADEKAMSSRNSPYRNVGAFTEFVMERLGAQES